MPKKTKQRIFLSTVTNKLTTAKTILVGMVISIWGILACFSLYFGFYANNFAPFNTVITGSGFFAWIITILLGKEVAK